MPALPTSPARLEPICVSGRARGGGTLNQPRGSRAQILDGLPSGWSFYPCGAERSTPMAELISAPGGGETRRTYPAGARTGDQRGDPVAELAAPPQRSSSKETVIGLREAGRSYAAIARQLTMPTTVHAQAAFVRALRQRPEQERAGLVQRELGRLDALEKKIRAKGEDDPTRARDRLAAVEKLRSALK
jgi:hypothetical protein